MHYLSSSILFSSQPQIESPPGEIHCPWDYIRHRVHSSLPSPRHLSLFPSHLSEVLLSLQLPWLREAILTIFSRYVVILLLRALYSLHATAQVVLIGDSGVGKSSVFFSSFHLTLTHTNCYVNRNCMFATHPRRNTSIHPSSKCSHDSRAMNSISKPSLRSVSSLPPAQ